MVTQKTIYFQNKDSQLLEVTANSGGVNGQFWRNQAPEANWEWGFGGRSPPVEGVLYLIYIYTHTWTAIPHLGVGDNFKDFLIPGVQLWSKLPQRGFILIPDPSKKHPGGGDSVLT